MPASAPVPHPVSGAHPKLPATAKASAGMYVFADTVTLLMEGFAYCVAIGPTLAATVWATKALGPLALIPLVLLARLVAAALFAVAISALRWLLARNLRPGRMLLSSPRAVQWIIADRLVKIVNRSPFRSLINDTTLLRALYYRGMGAKFAATAMLGQRAMLADPYLLRVGRDVLIGEEAIVSGHKVERNVVTLEPVEIGDGALIGARALVLPGVKIGAGAIIGAQSVVERGTVIPAGETWAGSPARKVEAALTSAAPGPRRLAAVTPSTARVTGTPAAQA